MRIKKSRAVAIWKQMEPGALRRLALAVFLVFGVVGPLTVLMESELHLVSWRFVTVQTVACGGMAATIVLLGRKKWWRNLLIVAFWFTVMTLNSGAFSLVGDERGLRVVLGSLDSASQVQQPGNGIALAPAELNAIYTQRSLLGTLAMALLTSGYIMFISVIGRELRKRTRLETEIAIAQNIQRSLFPEPSITLAWCTATGLSVPASEVGGDYFDMVKLSDSKLALVVADVTGHGVGAGILAAMTKSALHLQLDADPRPAPLLNQLNRTLHTLSDDKTFVTCAYALLDNSNGRLYVATAGHHPLLHYGARSRTITRLRTPGLALGMRPDSVFTALETPWEPGDALFLYTDGAVEAANARNEQFGEERLESAVLTSLTQRGNLCANVLATLRTFAGRNDFADDVSLIFVSGTGT